MNEASRQSYVLTGSTIVVSGLLWLCFGVFNKEALSFTNFGAGIDIVYLPAGIRLLLVLVLGIWGAIGITLANPFLVAIHIGEQSITGTLINSIIAGFVPLVCARSVQYLLGIDHNLSSLKPIHLPLLALVVSLATPLAFNIQFVLLGLKPYSEFIQNFAAMSLRDFLGCLAILVSARSLIAVARRYQT